MSGGNAQEAAAAADRFMAAHRALRDDPSMQFDLAAAAPPPEPPQWLIQFYQWLNDVLKPVARSLDWIGSFMPDAPYARIFLWTIIGVAALALMWVVVDRLRHGAWRSPWRRRARVVHAAADEPDWEPDAAPVRSWLREADAMAADGRYAEAVHHLLFRSIEDIQRRRPRVVRPARTSRELAAEPAIPPSARDLFAGIARLVERSLFGGRPVSLDDWTSARSAYADFALPGAWRG